MQFLLRVARAGQVPVKLRLEASNLEQACRSAEQQGYAVLRSQEYAANRFYVGTSKFPLLLFCHELKSLLDAGLTLSQCIQTLSKKESRPEVKTVLDTISESLNNGLSLSGAVEELPQHFPSLFIASIRACEKTGNVEDGLQRFSLYLEQIDVLRKRIISSSIYPAVVLASGALVLAFLLGFVVPKFSRIYEGRNMHLSTASEWLLWSGKMVDQHGLLISLALLTIISITFFYAMQAGVRANLMKILIRLPYIGMRIRIYQLSRLYRTLGMLFRSGIPMITAFDMVNELLGQTLQANVAEARKMISEGKPLSEAMDKCQLTTSVSLQLFQVGERSGQLETMMERAACFHEEEMFRWIDTFTKLFEPLLMAAIGLVIGLIVLLMYLPIFELASGIE
ncbi:MAG: type II secretion system F family protein [Methylotenera sp.]